MKLPQLAAQLYTVRDFCKTAADLAATARKIREIGYPAVQVSGIGPIPDEEVGRIMAGEGLTICATHEPSQSILDTPEKALERVRRLGFEPTHLDSHMLPSVDRSDDALRIKALIQRVAEQSGLRYLYDTDSAGKLRYFDAEIMLSGQPWPSVWQYLETLGPGTYHLIGHAAEPSPELDALCSADHPARRWASEVRTSDLAFFTSAATRIRLKELDFELITVADL